MNGAGVSASTTSTSFVELSSSGRVEICLWVDEAPFLVAANSVGVTVAGGAAQLSIGIDGTATGVGSTSTSAGAGQNEPTFSFLSENLAEAHHVFSPFGLVASGATATFSAEIYKTMRG